MGKPKSKELKPDSVSADDNDMWQWIYRNNFGVSFMCISVFALLVRFSVSVHPYSGAGTPPKYGDFEAQRHWMEITTNLPIKEWYRNSTSNDLRYWGLDYPPLTAYQSYVHGLVLRWLKPETVALFASRGHESYLGKLLMRWTVISSDFLIYFPAVCFFVVAYFGGRPKSHEGDVAWHSALLLINPCLILIDHGHFQYNHISLGLTVAAVAAVLSQKDILASVLYSLTLNHKQMSAYFAPAFFSHLLGKCLRRRNPLLEVSKLGVVVLATFTVVWWPYLHSKDAFLEVLSRLAPFERGIYEDYVANFWCTTSVLIKWKRLFTTESLKVFSLGATILTCLPLMVQQIWAPSCQGFLYGLLNSSFAFYLFSFQVHEKSILLPHLAASLLAMEEPSLFKWLTHYSLLSMFPLLCRDKLVLAYLALHMLFILLIYAPGRRNDTTYIQSSAVLKSYAVTFLVMCSIILHLIYLTMRPPKKYPYFFEALIISLCFSQFIFLTLYTNAKQWMLLKHNALKQKEKKHN